MNTNPWRTVARAPYEHIQAADPTQRRRRRCLYCGHEGHLLKTCITRVADLTQQLHDATTESEAAILRFKLAKIARGEEVPLR